MQENQQAAHEANPELLAAYEERERQREAYQRHIRAGDIVQDFLGRLMADPTGNSLVEAVSLAIAEGRDGFATLEAPRADTALATLLGRMDSLERMLGTIAGGGRTREEARAADRSAADAVAELARRFGAVEARIAEIARNLPAARRTGASSEGSLLDLIDAPGQGPRPAPPPAQVQRPSQPEPASAVAVPPAPSPGPVVAPVPERVPDGEAGSAGKDGFDERAYRSSGLGKRGPRRESGAGKVKSIAENLMQGRKAPVSLAEIKEAIAMQGENIRAQLCPGEGEDASEEHYERNIRQVLSQYACRFEPADKKGEFLYWSGDLELPPNIPKDYRGSILLPRINVIEARSKIDRYNNRVESYQGEELKYRFRKVPGTGGKAGASDPDAHAGPEEASEAA